MAFILKKFKFSKYNIIHRNSKFIDSSTILSQYLYKLKNID
jgi:folate-dependent tRNA-U54 methylase TrmFO/GidA